MCLTDRAIQNCAIELASTEAKNKDGSLLGETHTIDLTLGQKKSGDSLVSKTMCLFAFLFKKRFVDAARRTHPVVGKFIKLNTLNVFIVDPFTNTANPFCQLVSP
jgi:hypothetical protein